MGSEHGVMYREGPAFFARRMHEGMEPGPEMLVPEINDYMLEEIKDDLTLAVVDSELRMVGVVELDAPYNLRTSFRMAETDPLIKAIIQGLVLEVFVALGITQEVKVW